VTPATLAVCAGVFLLAGVMDGERPWAKVYLGLGVAAALAALGALLWP
jgi:hypothetical protein